MNKEGLIEKIYTSYDKKLNRTILWLSKINENNECLCDILVDWYFGEPSEKMNKLIIENMKEVKR